MLERKSCEFSGRAVVSCSISLVLLDPFGERQWQIVRPIRPHSSVVVQSLPCVRKQVAQRLGKALQVRIAALQVERPNTISGSVLKILHQISGQDVAAELFEATKAVRWLDWTAVGSFDVREKMGLVHFLPIPIQCPNQ